MLVLEINDGNIVLSQGDDVLYDEPGLALVEDKTIAFGYEASVRSRLNPRGLHDQFWQKMNAEPLSSPGGDAQNQADLVYLHLKSIFAGLDDPGEDTVVVAPSSTTPEQLSLFLGIAAEAGVRVRAIVDGCVAAAAAAAIDADAHHVDFTLHRGIVTALRVGDMLEKTRTTEVPEAGLKPLIEGWVDVIADRFIDETRFDPLRIAATEQQVFDQIVAKMHTERLDAMTVEVEHDGERRRVDVGEAALANKSDQRIGLMLNAIGDAGNLVLSHRARMVPGLCQRLADQGHRLTLLDAADARRSVAQHAERVLGDDGSVKLITALPSGATPRTDPEANAMQKRERDAAGVNAEGARTALLCRGIAVEIGDAFDSAAHPAHGVASEYPRASFRIEASGGNLRIASPPAELLLNEEPIAHDGALQIGDVLRIGDESFQLIRVLDPPALVPPESNPPEQGHG